MKTALPTEAVKAIWHIRPLIGIDQRCSEWRAQTLIDSFLAWQ
ncbi:hypothetical protein ACK6D9_01380 [Hoeflea sp. Naph1]